MWMHKRHCRKGTFLLNLKMACIIDQSINHRLIDKLIDSKLLCNYESLMHNLRTSLGFGHTVSIMPVNAANFVYCYSLLCCTSYKALFR